MKDRPIEAEAYPLQWPQGVPRRKTRQPSRFDRRLTIARALIDLRAEVDRLGGRYLVVSSNVPTRGDGLPYSNVRNPADPAVAVYFLLKGKPHCMPCDAWDRVEDNIRAIGKHIEALRGIARWGVQSVDEAFKGFAALPAPGWQAAFQVIVGEVPDSLARAKEIFRSTMRDRHPDRPGGMSTDDAQRLNVAMAAAELELA